MDDSAFWQLIESSATAGGDDLHRVEGAILRELTKLQPTEIEDFQHILRSKLDAAYTWELWGAAYIINGGCSDDAFEYFRCWLIGRGRVIFDSAVADPDSLASLIDGGGEFEALLYVGQRAYELVTGAKQMRRRARIPIRVPIGSNWDFDDSAENLRRMPSLVSRFG